ncbi:MAG: MMPL family transporter, partial [Propionibacterium acidifaciens]
MANDTQEVLMFTRIGLAVSRHPVAVIVVWALLLAVMTGLAFQGLGAGGLFDRLASAEATTPDTDSHIVYSMTRTDGTGGESITVVVSGIDVAGDPAGAAAAASAVRGDLAGLDGVASVTDAFTTPDPASQ